MHIKNLLIKNKIVKHLHILNQISTNKVFDNNSTNNINYLNNCLYAPVNNQNKSFYLKTIRIKTYNKTFTTYNHFKGSKQAFNCNPYKSIKLVGFWLVGMLKCFKISINKIVRLKIYGWSLVKIMILISTNKINDVMMDFNKIILKIILISSFGWSEVITKGMVENLKN